MWASFTGELELRMRGVVARDPSSFFDFESKHRVIICRRTFDWGTRNVNKI